ncbi:MAG: DUF935 family protein, partial [Nitrospinae bacterium]|nr:DUF935 family protein [Nitrospinota bacterium]
RSSRFRPWSRSPLVVSGWTGGAWRRYSGCWSALGDVHDRVRRDIVASDAAALDETLSSDLIRPLIDYNFGPQRRYPKVVTRLEGESERTGKLERIERLVRMGAAVPARIAAEAAGIPLSGDPDAPLTLAAKGA